MHLARIEAYSADVLPALLLIYVVIVVAVTGHDAAYYRYSDVVQPMTLVVLAPLVIVGGLTLRLAWALKRYVRFPQAGAVAVSYGLIASLIWVIVMVRATFPG